MGSKDDIRFVSFEEGGYRFLSLPFREHSLVAAGFLHLGMGAGSRPHHQPSAADTHSQAGATLGFKIMVGLLREDSRMEFHANGL